MMASERYSSHAGHFSQSFSRSRSRSRSRSSRSRKFPSSDYEKTNPGRIRAEKKSASSNFVCIRGLPVATSLHMLQASISELVGPYLFVQLLETQGSASLKALIEFENHDLVRRCIRNMDGARFGDRRITVCEIEDVETFMGKYGCGGQSTQRHGRTPNRSFSPPEIPEYEKGSSTRNYRDTGETSRQSVSEWLYPGGHERDRTVATTNSHVQSNDVKSRLEDLQTKLWSSVWKTRLSKNVKPEQPVECYPAVGRGGIYQSKDSGADQIVGTSSGTDVIPAITADVATGLFHIRRALEAIRNSDASRDAFQTAAFQLRQLNEELSEWIDMYFSREWNEIGGKSQPRTDRRMRAVEAVGKRANPNLVQDQPLNQTSGSILDRANPGVCASYFGNSSDLFQLVVKSGHDIKPSSVNWFTIGPAQPRYSSIAAMRRDLLPPLVVVSREKVKSVLAQFSHLVSASALSRCIGAVSTGGYVDLDWFSESDTLDWRKGASGSKYGLSNPCLSFANWYRRFEFVIKIGQVIEVPGDYLSSLSLYKQVIQLWWSQVSASDKDAGWMLWLPFYELFDKCWRTYAARSPEYRNKLHVFDAWWVFHQLDPVALQLRLPLPPYEPRSSTYLTQVACHYEEMILKPSAIDLAINEGPHQFPTALDSCSACGDPDHKIVTNGQSLPIFCPFISRRMSWCLDYYEGLCDRAECLQEGRHLCVHCGNPGHFVRTCPNCKFLV